MRGSRGCRRNNRLYSLARPFLFCLDAERAHDFALTSIEAAYRTGLNPLLAAKPAPLPTRVFGIDFPNPVGLAAGLDKNGAYIDALAALGFGFIEVGTTTPLPQAGNPKPRMFRLPEHEAVINRLGFNNGGVDALLRNVEKAKFSGVLGINIGKNKDTPNERAAADYLRCLERVYARASYITVNISSPNTQGLRDLQEEETLKRFIGALREHQERSRHAAWCTQTDVAQDRSGSERCRTRFDRERAARGESRRTDLHEYDDRPQKRDYVSRASR